ncbi:MAG: HNH endonuclease [Bacteroidales bacterium]|nr:HNH endonuclease [Bacteroidales bacterium]
MNAITNEMIHSAFEIGKKIYLNQLNRQDGIKALSNIGMKENSAKDYISCYSNLIQGKLFARTINAYGLEYYLGRILAENGKEGLRNALLSLSQHIDYYEEVAGANVKKGREIYVKFYDKVRSVADSTIFPDEVSSDEEYSEGKTKSVLVNSYERNHIARQKCIKHFGCKCQVCKFNFHKIFGELGKDFIHVHHKIDISTIGKEYSVDPIKDLIPVCPNCHSMLHKRKPAYSVEDLKLIVKKCLSDNGNTRYFS